MTVAEVVEKYKNLAGNYYSHIDHEEIAQCVVEDFKKAFAKKRIFLYGAGCVGRDFISLFHEMHISVEYVVDKNWDKIGEYKGVVVKDPQILKMEDTGENSLLIVACDRKIMPEIVNDLGKMNVHFPHIVCGHDIHILLQSSWCMIKAEKDGKIDLKNCYECTCLDNTCKSLCRYLKRLNGYDDEEMRGTEKVEMIGYLLSNICTLNCKNCCESVPYMPKESRHFVPGKQVVRDIVKMSAACKFLILLEFIGGEPFLHPDLPNIIQEVLTIKNIGMVHIFTNGTVLPGDALCKILNDPRITVYLSNYQVSYPDKFKAEVNKTVENLEKYGVQYFFGKKQNWMDFASYELQCEDEEKLSKKFPDCFLHNCNRLMEGKLYVCPHQYAGIKLGKLDEKNVIDIYKYTDEELAKELDKFKSYSYIDACKFCAMPYDAPTVLSGEQL